jgi:hypothetical protein
MGEIMKFILPVLVIICVKPEVNSQVLSDTMKWKHDFEVDYFPRFINCQAITGFKFAYENGWAFKESLELILKECTGKEYTLIRFPGVNIAFTGIEPKMMSENQSMYLNLFASGQVHSITIRNMENSREMEQCMKLKLANCEVKPAILNGKAVKSSWTFVIQRN